MGRADDLRARHEAELAVLELEDELIAAKESGEVSQDLKERLREARRVFREQRATADDAVADGDAVASPDPIVAKTEVQEG